MTASLAFQGTAAPTGAVTFKVDGSAAAPAACSVSGSLVICKANYPTASLAAGSHTITAASAADANYAAASATNTLTVALASPTITVSPTRILYGATPTALTADLAYTGNVAPTGAVSSGSMAVLRSWPPCTGSTSPLTCTVNYSTASLATGRYPITVASAADTNYSAASRTNTLAVNPASTTATLNQAWADYGAISARLSAFLAYTGAAPPTGAVSFSVNGTTPVLATCSGSASPLTCTGSYPIGSLANGSYPVTLSVAADSFYTAASALSTLRITPATPAFTLAPALATSGSASATLTATLAYPGMAAPTGAVTFTVANSNPDIVTCSGSASPSPVRDLFHSRACHWQL